MNIINIGILAHVDAGKTTLTESLLYASGAISARDRVGGQGHPRPALVCLDYKEPRQEIAQLDKLKAKQKRWRDRNGGYEGRFPAVKNLERLAAEFQQTRRMYRAGSRWEISQGYREKRPNAMGKDRQGAALGLLGLSRPQIKFEWLQADYGREVSKNSSLSEKDLRGLPRETV